MADQKISQLTGATTPLAGTEVLPIVQSGSTVKVSVANLTAGRSTSVSELKVVTANGQTNIVAGNTAGGNKIQVWNAAGNNDGYLGIEGFNIAYGQFTTAGNWKPVANLGIDYSANTPAAGMTSQLLNWYEEGVISIAATCDSGTITLSNNTLYYTRVGRVVHVNGQLTVGSVSSPTGNVYFGLPIQAATNSTVCLYLSGINAITGEIPVGLINAGQTIFYVQKLNQAAGTISGAAAIFKAGTQLNFQASYTV